MHLHQTFFKIDIALLAIGGLCFGYYHNTENDASVNAASILHISPRVRKAFSLKRALHNTDKQNQKMRARSLFRDLRHKNKLSKKHSDVILAIIKSRTINLKNTKHGYFNIAKSQSFKKFAKVRHLAPKNLSTQYCYLNKIYHLNKIMKYNPKASKVQLFNKLYAKIFHGKLVSNKHVNKYLNNTDIQ